MVGEVAGSAPVLAELDTLEASLRAVATDDANRTKITDRLKAILATWGAAEEKADDKVADKIQTASAEEIFAFIDKDLGRSARDRAELAHED